MINYNPKAWLPFIFRLTKADTFRKLLPLMFAVGVYSGIIGYVELEVFKVSKSDYINNLTLMHSVLGFVISLLLVFRTNTAYDRWWEGRKQWGTLTNSSRNLAIKLQSFIQDENERSFFKSMISTYAVSLKNHLRENQGSSGLVSGRQLKTNRHVPNQIAARIFTKLNELENENKIKASHIWLVNDEIKSLTDVCGACERIKNTPIPYTYSVYIKKFIVLYVITLPFGWINSLGYFMIPVVMFILYAFASLELIAEEIENPFGTDENDLPLEEMCNNIKKHVGELL